MNVGDGYQDRSIIRGNTHCTCIHFRANAGAADGISARHWFSEFMAIEQ